MIEQHQDYVSIAWNAQERSRFHWLWLRDNCHCKLCFNVNSRQKYYDSGSLEPGLHAQQVEHLPSQLKIVWSDGHRSTYDLDWLRQRDYSQGIPRRPEPIDRTPVPWGAGQGGAAAPASLAEQIRFRGAEVVESDDAFVAAVRSLYRHGILVLSADPSGKVGLDDYRRQFAGFLDRTYFGEFFDLEVKAEEVTDSVAFSTRALPLHTDIPYYAPQPDFQFLYGLDVNPECVRRGTGATRFADGFQAASALRDLEPEHFEVLSRIPVVNRAEYPQAGKIYENIVPIIKLHPDGSFAQVLNNPSKMFFDTVEFDDMPRLYHAYKRFKDLLLESPGYAHLWTQGDFIIWDNRRVFHGRGDFGSEGVRRILRGGYIRETELLARYRFAYAQAHPDQVVRAANFEKLAA